MCFLIMQEEKKGLCQNFPSFEIGGVSKYG
jgi:hypothetical protein